MRRQTLEKIPRKMYCVNMILIQVPITQFYHTSNIIQV